MGDEPLFRSQRDYELPLLRLLNELLGGQGEAAQVRRLFERRYGDQIPQDHHKTRRGGEIVWENNVNWCRNYLRERGFLDKPRTGIWRITKAGRQWVEKNPDADRLPPFVYNGQDESRQRQSSNKSSISSQSSQTSQPSIILRDNFFQEIAANLKPKLLDEISDGDIKLFPGRNLMQVYYREFPGSHYEVALKRDSDEVGFHFEASNVFSKDENLARLALMQPHIDHLGQILKYSVVAEPRGLRSAHLSIKLSSAAWNSNQAGFYADLLAQFITVTFPLLRQAFDATRAQRTRNVSTRAQQGHSPIFSVDGSNQEAHIILEQQITHIREYLRGRLDRPSDELLCEWVHFCYTFQLFKEGVELFNLIHATTVDPWPYERAKRIAKVCRIRVASPGA